MIAVDTNILIYAHRKECPEHPRALDRLRGLAESGDPWAVPWPCVHEFISAVTKSVFQPPTTIAQAFAAIDALVASGVQFLGEGEDHLGRLRRLCSQGLILGSAVHDARIAAICLSHGVAELWSADRDFSRYRDLKVVNPLVSS